MVEEIELSAIRQQQLGAGIGDDEQRRAVEFSVERHLMKSPNVFTQMPGHSGGEICTGLSGDVPVNPESVNFQPFDALASGEQGDRAGENTSNFAGPTDLDVEILHNDDRKEADLEKTLLQMILARALCPDDGYRALVGWGINWKSKLPCGIDY